MKRRRSNKRIIRKRKALKRRAILAPYLAELRRSRVPQSSVKAAETMMMILLGAEKDRRQG
jgi:hypothetical protein